MARTRSTSSALASILLLTFLFSVGAVQAQTTAFTYQGKLTDAGNPANGNYDLQFKLFDTVTVGTGTQPGATLVADGREILLRGNDRAVRWLRSVLPAPKLRQLIQHFAGAGCSEPERQKLRRALHLAVKDIPISAADIAPDIDVRG